MGNQSTIEYQNEPVVYEYQNEPVVYEYQNEPVDRRESHTANVVERHAAPVYHSHPHSYSKNLSSRHNTVPAHRSIIHENAPTHTVVHESIPSHTVVHESMPSHSVLHGSAPTHTVIHESAPTHTIIHEPTQTVLHEPTQTVLHEAMHSHSRVVRGENLPTIGLGRFANINAEGFDNRVAIRPL